MAGFEIIIHLKHLAGRLKVPPAALRRTWPICTKNSSSGLGGPGFQGSFFVPHDMRGWPVLRVFACCEGRDSMMRPPRFVGGNASAHVKLNPKDHEELTPAPELATACPSAG